MNLLSNMISLNYFNLEPKIMLQNSVIYLQYVCGGFKIFKY